MGTLWPFIIKLLENLQLHRGKMTYINNINNKVVKVTKFRTTNIGSLHHLAPPPLASPPSVPALGELPKLFGL